MKKTIAGDLRPQRNEFLNGLARNGTTTNGGPAVSSLDRQGRIANGESNGTHDAMKTMPRTAKFNGSMLPRPVKEAQRVTGERFKRHQQFFEDKQDHSFFAGQVDWSREVLLIAVGSRILEN